MPNDDDRIRCTDCRLLNRVKECCDGFESIPGAGWGYLPEPGRLHRCVAFQPLQGAEDQRPGSERFAWLYRLYARCGLIQVRRKRAE